MPDPTYPIPGELSHAFFNVHSMLVTTGPGSQPNGKPAQAQGRCMRANTFPQIGISVPAYLDVEGLVIILRIAKRKP